MDSADHRASQDLPSLPPRDDSPLPSSGLRRFLNRTTSTASLNTINTLLPQYSELTISDQEANTVTLWGDDLGVHRETIHSQADDSDTTLAGGPSHSENSNPRVSIASVPPRYSFVPPRYSHVPAQQVTTEGVSRTEHTYSICSGLKNKPWATLRVFNQPPLEASPRNQKYPRFSSGDMIAGLIEFTLDSPQTVNSVTVSVHGRIIRGYLAEASDTFLDHQVSLWTRADGDPRSPKPGSTNKFNGRLKGTYQFPFVFPFPTHVDISTSTPFLPPSLQTSSDSMCTSSSSPATATTSSSFPPATVPSSSRFRSLSIPANATFFSSSKNPSSVQLSTSEAPRNEGNSSPVANAPEESEKARLKRAASEEQDRAQVQLEGNSGLNSLPVHVFPIPQTFLERGIHANVQYELGLHIAHGMLRPASKLNTTIVYTPSITPPAASVARQRAYSEHAPLPGPAQDPDGWQTLPKVTISGELLGQQKVEVECTLSLAKPLCYTRGTIIPCHLTLESSNSHALSLLWTPKSPLVRLTRRVRYAQYSSPTPKNASNRPPTSGDSLASGFPTSLSRGKDINFGGGKRGDAKEVDEVELAVWWVPPKDAPQDVYLKTLEGEIHLAKDLQPTCRFPSFSVEYAVEMLPLVSSIVIPACSEGEQCLLVQPVEIATRYAEEGPVSSAFTKPMSVREREKRKKEREDKKEQAEIVWRVAYSSRGN